MRCYISCKQSRFDRHQSRDALLQFPVPKEHPSDAHALALVLALQLALVLALQHEGCRACCRFNWDCLRHSDVPPYTVPLRWPEHGRDIGGSSIKAARWQDSRALQFAPSSFALASAAGCTEFERFQEGPCKQWPHSGCFRPMCDECVFLCAGSQASHDDFRIPARAVRKLDMDVASPRETVG